MNRATALGVSLATALVPTLAASAAVVGLAAPAHADAAAPVLSWEISPRFDDHLSTHTLSDGASEDEDGVVSFPLVAADLDPATGAGTLTYDGSVKGAFAMMGTEYYSITLADPVVSVTEDGSGSLSAVVSAANAATQQGAAATTDPARVVVTTFSDSARTPTSGLSTLQSTPDWAGVLPIGSPAALALGLSDTQPVDGQSFAPEFLAQLTPGVRAHFYASGSGSDATKQPSAFAAEAAGPQVAVRTTSATSDALVLDVDGSGFTGVTNPGDDGVYVGLAPAGGLPDTDSQQDQDAFAAAAWVPAAQMADGTIDVTLTADPADLDAERDYSVYTWQAHGHSNTSQDTETAVAIDWAALGLADVASTTTVKVKKKPTTKRRGVLLAKVTGEAGKATGKAVVTAKKGGKTKKVTKAVTRGKARVTLPTLSRGKWKVVVVFKPSDTYARSTDRLTLRVR